ncbi:MAG TPA: hypothetical protein VFI29_11455 [Hanamia sp.]|nr:hypothetical protein [Hanamia sp.]
MIRLPAMTKTERDSQVNVISRRRGKQNLEKLHAPWQSHQLE